MGWLQAALAAMGVLNDQNEAGRAEDQLALDRLRLDEIGIPPEVLLDPQILGTPQASIADPRLQQALFTALNKLQQWGTGALTTEDKMALSLAEDEAARRGQIAQSGIEQQMQARGQGGQGAELAMKQQAAQSGQQAAYQAGLQNMLSARDRAYQATGQAGNLATSMSAQDMARKAALDRIAEANAQARTEADLYNKRLPWQTYQARVNKEATARGLTTQNIDLGRQNTDRQNTNLSNMGAIAGQVGQNWNSTPPVQTNPGAAPSTSNSSAGLGIGSLNLGGGSGGGISGKPSAVGFNLDELQYEDPRFSDPYGKGLK
jgi:hypothetical protein